VQQTLAPTSVEFLPHLGVTERCCAEDLKEDPDAALSEIAEQHAIVAKFIELRSLTVPGQETIRAIRGPAPVFSLHAGRQRGGTVADSQHKVVWLLASQTHREGDRSDAYAHIERLHARGALFPTETDYMRLFKRRNAEVVPLMLSRAMATLERAREHPDVAHTVLLPGALTMSLLVREERDESGEYEQLWLALDPRALEDKWLVLIQAALTSDENVAPWEYTKDFPGRGPDRHELRFTCRHEVERE
jgi:hypothetical protein